jgi:hypothetical protein
VEKINKIKETLFDDFMANIGQIYNRECSKAFGLASLIFKYVKFCKSCYSRISMVLRSLNFIFPERLARLHAATWGGNMKP